MKIIKLIRYAVVFMFLIILAVVLSWTAMANALKHWDLSGSNRLSLAYPAILNFILGIFAFIFGNKKGIWVGFISAICVSLVVSFCFFIYLLFGLRT